MVRVGHLRRLARLHRKGVPGAGDQLLELYRAHPTAFNSIAPGQIERGSTTPDSTPSSIDFDDADLLAEIIERSTKRASSSRKEEQLSHARTFAERLGQEAHFESNRIHLNPDLLAEVARYALSAQLVFGRDNVLQGVSLALLHRAHKALKGATVHEVYLAGDLLHIAYRTEVGSGLYRFVLNAPLPKDELVEVPLVPPRVVHELDIQPVAPEPELPSIWERMVMAIVEAA